MGMQIIAPMCLTYLLIRLGLLVTVGVVRWCEGVMYLISLGRALTDTGLQLGKACSPCNR